MIINTGGRTDSVQYYHEWLINRFKEGYVLVRNPLFPSRISKYTLDPAVVDCVVFCSKNYAPILDDLSLITDRFHTYFYYTITPYAKDIEPGVPDVTTSIQTIKKLSSLVGKQRVAWRYDPVLLTKKYTVQSHLASFEAMTKEIAPYVERCIFSFVEMYKRLEKNMPELIALNDEQKDYLAKSFGEIASKYGMILQTCGTDANYEKYGIRTSGCMQLSILGDANGIEFKDLKHKGMRQGCHCIESRDIGAYDTCLNGCKYCYANKKPEVAFEKYKEHDPSSPLMIGRLKETDTILEGKQKSFLKK